MLSAVSLMLDAGLSKYYTCIKILHETGGIGGGYFRFPLSFLSFLENKKQIEHCRYSLRGLGRIVDGNNKGGYLKADDLQE